MIDCVIVSRHTLITSLRISKLGRLLNDCEFAEKCFGRLNLFHAAALVLAAGN